MSNIGEVQENGNVLTILGEIKAAVHNQSALLTETRDDVKDMKDRMARVETGTGRAIPIVDDLDRTVQGHEHRIGALEQFKDAHCKDHTASMASAGGRWWDAFKAFLGPLAAVIVTWLIATKGGSK